MQKIVESECVTFFFKQELEEEEKNIGTQFVFQKHLEIRNTPYLKWVVKNLKCSQNSEERRNHVIWINVQVGQLVSLISDIT